MRLVPFGSFSGLAVMAATGPETSYLLAGLFGAGAAFTGKRLLDRRANARRELSRRARENVKELGRVAREDRLAAPQTKRLAALQAGSLERWGGGPGGRRRGGGGGAAGGRGGGAGGGA